MAFVVMEVLLVLSVYLVLKWRKVCWWRSCQTTPNSSAGAVNISVIFGCVISPARLFLTEAVRWLRVDADHQLEFASLASRR